MIFYGVIGQKTKIGRLNLTFDLFNPLSANQLTGFYMRATLALNGLIEILIVNTIIIRGNMGNIQIREAFFVAFIHAAGKWL